MMRSDRSCSGWNCTSQFDSASRRIASAVTESAALTIRAAGLSQLLFQPAAQILERKRLLESVDSAAGEFSREPQFAQLALEENLVIERVGDLARLGEIRRYIGNLDPAVWMDQAAFET